MNVKRNSSKLQGKSSIAWARENNLTIIFPFVLSLATSRSVPSASKNRPIRNSLHTRKNGELLFLWSSSPFFMILFKSQLTILRLTM